MTQPDEGQARIDAVRGVRARELSENPLLVEAFEELERAYFKAWRSTGIDDSTGREKLFLAFNVVGKVKEHLSRVMANGRLAENDLREIARAAERQKTWAEIR